MARLDPAVSYPTPAGRFEMGTHGDFNGDGAVDFAYPSASGRDGDDER